VRRRFAVLARFFACCVLLSAPVFPQEPAPNSQPGNGSQNASQKNPEQRPLPEPKVFFPMAEQPEMEMHHHGSIPEVMPQFPHLGDSQRIVPGPIYQLEDLEHMAAAHNPTLAQAQRAVEAARGRQRQSGLYPNPTIGYEADEIRGGTYGGGEQGFFVEQPILLGGKLGLNRKVGASEVKERQAEAEAQRYRVENDVRMAYYHTLAAQERLAVDLDLVTIAQTTVRVVRQLDNVGEADETEVLEAEAEEQSMEIAAGVSQHVLRREWEALISVVGVPSLPEGSVAGAIDTEIPSLDEGQLSASLLTSSPARKSAQAGVERAELRCAGRNMRWSLILLSRAAFNRITNCSTRLPTARLVCKALRRLAYISMFGTATRAASRQLAPTSKSHRTTSPESTSHFASVPQCTPKTIEARA
jgi:hypothetical protein